jgi:hypothetical protein
MPSVSQNLHGIISRRFSCVSPLEPIWLFTQEIIAAPPLAGVVDHDRQGWGALSGCDLAAEQLPGLPIE